MSEIVRIVSFCQPTSCCKHNAKLQQSLVCIPWRTLWFSRWWRPGTRRRQSWTTERWNTSVEEDTVTWSYKRNTQLTVYNSCATTTRVYLSVNYSFISHKPATGRVQFEILLPFIIRVIERINFVTRLPWYAVVITLLFRKEEQSWQKKKNCQNSMKTFHWSGFISYLIQFSHLLQGALKLLQRPHSRQTFLRVVQTNLHFWLLRQKRR